MVYGQRERTRDKIQIPNGPLKRICPIPGLTIQMDTSNLLPPPSPSFNQKRAYTLREVVQTLYKQEQIEKEETLVINQPLGSI